MNEHPTGTVRANALLLEREDHVPNPLPLTQPTTGDTVLTVDGDGTLVAVVTYGGATTYVVNVDGHDRCYAAVGHYVRSHP
jgi:hypothetical protein